MLRSPPRLFVLGAVLVACPTRGSLLDPDASIAADGAIIEPPVDAPRLGAPCRPWMPPRQVDPCPVRGNCGLPMVARVNITGARSTLTGVQVKVTLPAAVRMATGPACDRLAFRTPTNQWVPHFVTNCAMGEVWIRPPEIVPAGTLLALYYGGTTPSGSASYDDTFDRVPFRAAGLVAAYTFDEGFGTRTCPVAGSGGVPFDAYIHDEPYARGTRMVRRPPDLWTRDAPISLLALTNVHARFTQNQTALNFPRSDVIVDPRNPMATKTDRLVNWRSETNTSFTRLTQQLTVGVWVYTETPANEFDDNFQTVVCFGMPENPVPARPNLRLEGISIFNPWAIFFRSDDADSTFLQGNTCVFPCANIDHYAHITTREPFTRAEFTRRWHFAALTFDSTTRPHATRRSYFDERMYEFPADLDLWPQDQYCPRGVCRFPPEAPIHYYDAPVVLGADMNNGEARLGLEGRIDDLFIIGRAISPDEMRAYRERRAYVTDPLVVTVMP